VTVSTLVRPFSSRRVLRQSWNFSGTGSIGGVSAVAARREFATAEWGAGGRGQGELSFDEVVDFNKIGCDEREHNGDADDPTNEEGNEGNHWTEFFVGVGVVLVILRIEVETDTEHNEDEEDGTNNDSGHGLVDCKFLSFGSCSESNLLCLDSLALSFLKFVDDGQFAGAAVAEWSTDGRLKQKVGDLICGDGCHCFDDASKRNVDGDDTGEDIVVA